LGVRVRVRVRVRVSVRATVRVRVRVRVTVGVGHFLANPEVALLLLLLAHLVPPLALVALLG